MAKQTVISPLNPFHFVQVKARNAAYNTGTIDNTLQRFNFQTNEQKALFFDRIQRTDVLRFVVDCSTNVSRTLQILNAKGDVVLTIGASITKDVAGNLDNDGDQLHTYAYKLANYNAIALDGYYALKLVVNYDGTNIDTFISEPFWIKDLHKDTVLIQYRHSVNKLQCFFSQLPIIFNTRLKARIAEYSPHSVDTVYSDQEQNIVPLYSQTFGVLKFRVGGNGTGIADWKIRNLNDIMSCDNVFIDGTQYTKSDGAKWTPSTDADWKLSGWDIDVRMNNEDYYNFTNSALKLFTIPAYPFAITPIGIGVDSADTTISSPAIINNLTELNIFITNTNGASANADLFGVVSIVSGNVVYTNADNENYRVSSSNIYTTHADFTLNSGGSFPALYGFSFTFQRGDIVIDWGDTSGAEYAIGGKFASTTASHTYSGGPATYPVKLWGKFDRLTVTDAAVTNFGGTMPSQLKSLTVQATSFASNTFNYSILALCRANINSIYIYNSKLTTIVQDYSTNSYPNLLYLNFSGNALSSSAASGFIIAVDNAANALSPKLQNGGLSLVSQVPAISFLTVAGNMAKSDLVNNLFWTVNT